MSVNGRVNREWWLITRPAVHPGQPERGVLRRIAAVRMPGG
jgi:hypothetical protein